MKKGVCSPLEGVVTSIVKVLEAIVSVMDAKKCYALHQKPEMTPVLQKIPVQKPRHFMSQKPPM